MIGYEKLHKDFMRLTGVISKVIEELTQLERIIKLLTEQQDQIFTLKRRVEELESPREEK
jgi:hypothetical protein